MKVVDPKALGARVRERREALGMSQGALAQAVDMKQQGIDAIEQGRVKRPRYLREIATTLDSPEEYLLYGERSTNVDLKVGPVAPKFIRNRAFKFYVEAWRKFMVGEDVKAPARACGLDVNEYQAHEAYPINFTIGQVMALGEELGVRPEQFFFPPPKAAAPVPRRPVKSTRRTA